MINYIKKQQQIIDLINKNLKKVDKHDYDILLNKIIKSIENGEFDNENNIM